MSIDDKSYNDPANQSAQSRLSRSSPDIDTLVADLKPAHALHNNQLWLAGAMSLPLVTAILLIPQGLRSDFTQALEAGTVFWKAGFFLLLGVAMMLYVKSISRPVVGHKGLVWPMLLALTALIATVFVSQQSQSANGTFGMVAYALDSAPMALSCAISVTVGGLASFAVLWRLWLRNTASVFPRKLGFVSGLFCGGLAAMVYSLSCTQDNIFYILFYYGGSVLGMGALGYYVGAKYMKW